MIFVSITGERLVEDNIKKDCGSVEYIVHELVHTFPKPFANLIIWEWKFIVIPNTYLSV